MYELNQLPNCDGSCRFTLSHTHVEVMAGVNGPVEARLANTLPTKASIEVVVRPPIGSSSPAVQALERWLAALAAAAVEAERYARTTLCLTLHILRNGNAHNRVSASSNSNQFDCFHRAALVNAMVGALVAAGLAMRATPCAVLVAIAPQNSSDMDETGQNQPTRTTSAAERIIVDPGIEVYGDGCGRRCTLTTFVFDVCSPTTSLLASWSVAHGDFLQCSESDWFDACELARVYAARKMQKQLRLALGEKF